MELSPRRLRLISDIETEVKISPQKLFFFPTPPFPFVSSVGTKLHNLIQTYFKKRYYQRLIFDFMGELLNAKLEFSHNPECCYFHSHLNTPVTLFLNWLLSCLQGTMGSKESHNVKSKGNTNTNILTLSRLSIHTFYCTTF